MTLPSGVFPPTFATDKYSKMRSASGPFNIHNWEVR